MKLLAILVLFVLGAVGLFAAMLHFPIFAIFSYPLVGLGLSVWHERKWRGRRHWIRTRGTVVGHVREGSEQTLFPKIEYVRGDYPRVFRSNYDGEPEIGEPVDVVYDPASNEAEQLNWSNRWGFTVFPAGTALGYLYLVWYHW